MTPRTTDRIINAVIFVLAIVWVAMVLVGSGQLQLPGWYECRATNSFFTCLFSR